MQAIDLATSLPLNESDYYVSPASIERAAAKLARRFEVGEHIELHGVRFQVASIDGLNLVLEVGVTRIRIASVSEMAERTVSGGAAG